MAHQCIQGINVKLWRYSQKDPCENPINASAPKILVKDQDGKFHLINSSSGNGTVEYGGKKYYENIY